MKKQNLVLENYINKEYSKTEWESFSEYSQREIKASIKTHIKALEDKGIEISVENIDKSIEDTYKTIKELDAIEVAKNGIKDYKDQYDYLVLDHEGNILKAEERKEKSLARYFKPKREGAY